MKLKLPFAKKKEEEIVEEAVDEEVAEAEETEATEEVTAESETTEDTVETEEETEEDLEETLDAGATIGISTVEEATKTMEAGEYDLDEDDEEDDDEEYEYVTPHYGLRAIVLTVVFILIGAAATFFLVRDPMAEAIRQMYLDQGYITTEGAFATAEDIALGKTAYVGGKLITGTYVELDTSNATATAGDIMAGYTAYVNGQKVTGTIQSFTPEGSYVPGTKNIVIPKGYYLNGNVVVSGDENFSAGIIKKGVTIFGVTGTRD